MNKQLELKRAFRIISRKNACSDWQNGVARLDGEWTNGVYNMPGLEVRIFPDGCWVLGVLAREDGVLGELDETCLSALFDYERIFVAASVADANDPVIAEIQTKLSKAAREEASRLADALLELMDDKS